MLYTTINQLYISVGTNKPLNITINVFGKVYIHIPAACQARECHEFVVALLMLSTLLAHLHKKLNNSKTT